MKKSTLVILLGLFIVTLSLTMSVAIICTNSCNNTSYLDSSVPHASIVKWSPGSYGNYSGAGHEKKPLPIWVTLSFDKAASESFVKNYFRFLAVTNRSGYCDTRNSLEFLVTIPGTINRAEFEFKIDQANRHFDPEIEKQEQRAIREAKLEAEKIAADKIAAEVEVQRRADAEKKAEEERKLIVKINAEESARILAFKLEQQQIEAERIQKIIEQKEQLKESAFHSYSITKLPTDFYILEGYCAFNNNGQVVGCVSKKASTWESIYRQRQQDNPYCTNAHQDKYEDAIAACWERGSGLRVFGENNKTIANAINDAGLAVISCGKNNEKKQTFLWNTITGNFQKGPIGNPYFIADNNLVFVNERLAHEGFLSIIWNSIDNSISTDCRSELACRSIMNKNGNSIKYDTNLKLQCGSNSYLLLTEGDSRILAINDNDQVAALVDIKWGIKTFKAIQILDKYGNSVRSKVLKELVGYNHIQLIGFNKHGQVLLSTDRGCFFLDPDAAKI